MYYIYFDCFKRLANLVTVKYELIWLLGGADSRCLFEIGESMMSRKKLLSTFIFLIFIYIVAAFLGEFYFSQGKAYEFYTYEWLFRRSFMYTWLIMILFLLGKRLYSAIFTTMGCFLGILIGELLGNWIIAVNQNKLEIMISSGQTVDAEMIYQANRHYGVLPIWFVVFTFMLGLGLFIDSRRNYKVD